MKFVLRRLGFYILALLAAVVIDFVIPRLLPGDPAATILGQNTSLTPNQVEDLRQAMGLTDDPMPVQFIQFLSHALRGDFGLSYTYFPAPVTSVISTGLIWTLLLGVTSLVIAFALGNLLGVVGAWRRGGVVDTIMPPLLIFIGAFPAFFLGLGLLYVLSVRFGIFPASHAYEAGLEPGFNLEFLGSVAQHMFLPALVMVLVSIGGWALGMRNVMISVLAEDYITMAEAKGLSQSRIMFGYAARNAMLPSITGFGIALGFLLSGQILIETVFSYPGLGYLMVGAVGSRDYPLMQGLFLLITVAVLLANFLVDIVYAWLDPRVRNA